MEFWFYTQSYVSISGSSNFGTLEISWDFHTKVIINNQANVFTAICYPVIDLSNPSKDPLPKTFQFTGTQNNVWIYISCGVNPTESNFFLTTMPFNISTSNFSSLNIIPSSTVGLKIQETSTISYGITHIYNLRLWNCFSCNSSAIYM